MKDFRLLFTFLLVLVGFAASAQSTVKGTVKSSNGAEPLIGVTVVVKGTTAGSATDVDGNFEISVGDAANAVLVLSYTGFTTLEVPVAGKSSLDITMEPALNLLEEFVTVAYGTVKKEALTGSVGTISSEAIAKRPLNNITTAIEGAVPGVITQTANGQPGSGLAIRIRGFGSINASQDPLFVVDGVPYVGGTSNINPDDVESISILKDASATALYGSRAANGVVIITTKKGKKDGRNNVSVKVTQGVASRGLPEYDRLDAFQYYPVQWESYRNSLVYPASGAAISRDSASRVASGLTSRTGIAGLLTYNPFNVAANAIVNPNGTINPSAELIYADDLDWTKDLMRNGDRKDYSVNFSGGSDKYDYFLSAGYLQEDGYTLNTDFKRYTARLNVNVQPTKWLRTGLNISGNHSISNTAADGGSTNFVNPFFYSRNIGPIYPVFAHNMTTGEYLLDANGQRFWDLGNLGSSGLGVPNRPSGGFAGRHALAETTLNSQLFTRTVASVRSSTDLFFLKNFKFTNNASADFQYQQNNSFENTVVGDGAPAGRSRRQVGSSIGLILSQLLNYNKEFGGHGVDLLAGHESYNQRDNDLNGFKQGLSLSGNTELNNFTTINSLTSALDRYTIESYFSRANYNYRGKYIITGSLRRDGNSRFASESRWGTFWSAGAGWNIDKEKFLDVAWLDQLKLRSSYGVVGVADGIGFYAYQGLYGFANNANEAGIVQSQTAFLNRSLSWETNEQFDVGFDFSLFKGRISGSLEYYNRLSRDLLFDVPQPLSSGALTVTQNTATMVNKGIEANLDIEFIRTNDFVFSTNINVSTVNNEITKMPETVPEFVTGTKKYSVGASIFEYWLRTYYGVDPSDGSALYVSANKASATGRRLITNSAGGIDTVTTLIANGKFEYNGSVIPDLYGSVAPTITFKGFTLNALLTFQLGGLTYDGLYQSLMSTSNYGGALHTDILKRWQNEGDVTDVPRMDAGRGTDFNATSSRWLIDASYLNIRNVNLSYSLPKALISKWKISGAQVFVGAENVAFFSKRKGMNNQQAFSGVTSNAYPPARVISGGFTLNF
jgi:TonB-linked SusC/RagA family outer membrane protein